MRKITTFCVIIATFLVACGEAVYTNTEYGYSVRVPDGMSIEPIDGYNGYLLTTPDGSLAAEIYAEPRYSTELRDEHALALAQGGTVVRDVREFENNRYEVLINIGEGFLKYHKCVWLPSNDTFYKINAAIRYDAPSGTIDAVAASLTIERD